MQTLLVIIVFWLVAVSLIFEFAGIGAFGSIIKEDQLDSFFDKHRDEYLKATVDHNAFLGGYNLPFIAKFGAGLVSRWHIYEYGRIPRWSKWSGWLDRNHKRLYVKPPKKNISDL